MAGHGPRVECLETTAPDAPDDDRFHAADAVGAHEFAAGHHRDPPAHRRAGRPHPPPDAADAGPVARAQQDERPLPPTGHGDRGGDGVAPGADDHQGHRSGHCATGPRPAPLPITEPLRVRRNPSSWPSSAVFSRNGVSSEWPRGAAGARL